MVNSICTYGFIPMRSEPREQAEMVSQLLFGESFSVLEREGKWIKVTNHFDNYSGWVDAKLVEVLNPSEVEAWEKGAKWIIPAPYVKIVSEPGNELHYLSGGSTVCFNRAEENSFLIGTKTYEVPSNNQSEIKEGGIDEVARSFLNTPYLWGGRSFFGIDCSGFTQIVYKIMGVALPRDASQQVAEGTNVSFVEEAKKGDLAFFDNAEGNITHVGLCLDNGEIIHASGCVRIDKLDHQGIYNVASGKYSHKLRVIKRII
ncbi:glycoside hydrolase [Marinilabiliaceae bacterium JC017]|nr:glycoside hydrolase [Marinilabiliaceae bacterium JC017]